ncbi:DUF2804 domain-containing protein [Cytobacillus solani]|uniref:DUF2804 domain-containing protein n=1 Tax=Cytobacillus solani TaxID=1637975 RepID=UPI0006ABC1B8|nr:DUF2804 domain-containing protein [Cytobacillus solani]KOP71706.1 hypothetical protein AMS60_20585 [Bacillus sp. FJAT-21945]USK54929.1 DUF2804 domain-containing protein [Cytobacillus solani]
MAREITERVDMCDENGRLAENSIGWARQPLFNCNVSGRFLRKKKWNYWCVTSPEFLFSVTISHLDYAAVLFVYVLDLQSLSFQEQTAIVPFGFGCKMPEEVNASVKFEGKQMAISFEEKGDSTSIRVHCPHFSGRNKPLVAEVRVERPRGHESINVVVPWSETRFQFTSKQTALPAAGTVHWNRKEYIFNNENAFGCLDFGRGVWPYHSTWNWAQAAGIVNGRSVGLNFGGQWTDGTGQTENGIVVDRKLSKINEDISWEYDNSNYLKPWTLKTAETDQVSLTFQPLFERKAATNAWVIRSSVHQMIGTFNGYIRTNDGEKIMIESFVGWAEDHKASW